MKKTTSYLIGKIPFVGKAIQSKYDFFAFPCSPLMDELTRRDGYKLIRDWMAKHPDQVISPEKARELLAKGDK